MHLKIHCTHILSHLYGWRDTGAVWWYPIAVIPALPLSAIPIVAVGQTFGPPPVNITS
jgi:hypothetical protein